MAIYHLSVKTISRSAGRSATAAIAYRTGSRIADERTGLIHNYTRRSGVEHCEIFLPQHPPEWANNRASLWNAAEQKEPRRNSTVAREFEIAFPSELDGKQRLELFREFCGSLVARHGMAVDGAIHAPGRTGDQRNYHAHVLCSTRRLTAEGFMDKTRELDDVKRGEVSHWRGVWAEMTNRHLEKAGRSERVDHRSLEAQREDARTQGDREKAAGLERIPTIHLGHVAAQMERRGIETERGNEQREILLKNAEIRPLARALRVIEDGREKYGVSRRSAPVRANVPPPFAREHLRSLSELKTLNIDNRAEISRPGDAERTESQTTQRAQRENLVPRKTASPEVVRLEWQTLRRNRLAYVQKKARRIAARGAVQVERQREKISTHEKQRPAPPRGLSGLFKGHAYEKAVTLWQGVKNGLDRRLIQLKNRLGLVRDYMRTSGGYGFPSPGERLADSLAAKADPELAGQVNALDAQKKAQDREAYRARVYSRSQERGRTGHQETEEKRRDTPPDNGNRPGQSRRDEILEKFREKMEKDRENGRKGRGR